MNGDDLALAAVANTESQSLTAAAGHVVEKHTIKKSCDFCVKRKRHCDGYGLRRCSFCIAKDQRECHYSARSRMTPRSAAGTHRRGDATDNVNDAVSGAPLPPGRTFFPTDREELDEGAQRRTPMGARATNGNGQGLPLTLKRGRLSASPATGLVGLQENSFLGDFFDCTGFFPLASDSAVRETMVEIMSPSRAADRFASGGAYLTRPSTSSFWAAIAIGAMLKGVPFATVSKVKRNAMAEVESYVRLAEGVLAVYTGPATAELARAWVILAYMHGCKGDHEKFYKYLTLACDFVHYCNDKQSEELDLLPLAFDELVNLRETIVLFRGDADGPHVIAAEPTLPKINGLATEGMVCKFVLQWYRRFEHRVFAEDRKAESLGYGGASGETILAERMAVASNFSRLEEFTRRPNLLSDMGILSINGELMFDRVAKGDVCGALDRLGTCVEVCERFPGLCRSFSKHKVHQALSMVAAAVGTRARGLYERLRTVYNLMQEPGLPLVPPLHHWQGISAICGIRTCRAVSEGFASLRVLREQGDEDERSRPYGTGNPGKRHGASPGLGACQRTPRGQACGASSPTRPHLRHAVPRRSDGPMEAVPLGTRAEVSTSSSSVVNFGTEASVDAPGVGGAAMEEVAGGEGISELIYRAIEVAEEGCDYADEDWLTTSYAVLDLVGPRMEHG